MPDRAAAGMSAVPDCAVDIACCVLELVNISSFKQVTYMWSKKATDKGL